MKCSRCNRCLFRTPINVAGLLLGPKCAAAVRAGVVSRRARVFNAAAARADARQLALFAEVQP